MEKHSKINIVNRQKNLLKEVGLMHKKGVEVDSGLFNKLDKNYEKFKVMEKGSYEGKCIGLVDGKVVVADKDFNKVVKTLKENYPDREATIASVPKRNATFVL